MKAETGKRQNSGVAVTAAVPARRVKLHLPGAVEPAPGAPLTGSGLLAAAFFDRDPRTVGQELLGKLLVRRYRGQLLIGRVVETEAYLGALDPAAHAFRGKTARNAVLFGPPGFAYVYLIYGNHFCLNVSCMSEGEAGCVLFRALEPVRGLAAMAKLRALEHVPQLTLPAAGIGRLRLLCGGPGRLTQALRITRQRHNGMPLTSAHSELFLADDGFRPARILTTVRMNVNKAAEMPLRYIIAGNPFVSGKKTL
jgi:DNA-3-methyladenine glycosylase